LALDQILAEKKTTSVKIANSPMTECETAHAKAQSTPSRQRDEVAGKTTTNLKQEPSRANRRSQTENNLTPRRKARKDLFIHTFLHSRIGLSYFTLRALRLGVSLFSKPLA
jgi:hypothetical protein